MNIIRLVKLLSIGLISANIAIILTNIAVVISGLRVLYLTLLLGLFWFFCSQYDESFRLAFANVLKLQESDYVVFLFIVLLGSLTGVIGVWLAVL